MRADELDALSRYRLPDGVARLAPNRYPFSGYPPHVLARAAEDVLRSPERRGIFPRAVRGVFGVDEDVPRGRWTILEAHLNAEKIEDRSRDFLLELGFEDDGLFVSMPEHFSGHFTVKYKIGSGDSTRKRECYYLLMRSCNRLTGYLGTIAPTLEYNLEAEAYNSYHRREWCDISAIPWPSDLLYSRVTRDIGCITILASDSVLTKRADIHAKLACDPDGDVAVSITTALENVGFYTVVTRSGNTVLTGQFVSVVTAKKVFVMIADAVERYRGVVELTLEPTPYFFRSTIFVDGKVGLAAIPPLISIEA